MYKISTLILVLKTLVHNDLLVLTCHQSALIARNSSHTLEVVHYVVIVQSPWCALRLLPFNTLHLYMMVQCFCLKRSTHWETPLRSNPIKDMMQVGVKTHALRALKFGPMRSDCDNCKLVKGDQITPVQAFSKNSNTAGARRMP